MFDTCCSQYTGSAFLGTSPVQETGATSARAGRSRLGYEHEVELTEYARFTLLLFTAHGLNDFILGYKTRENGPKIALFAEILPSTRLWGKSVHSTRAPACRFGQCFGRPDRMRCCRRRLIGYSRLADNRS